MGSMQTRVHPEREFPTRELFECGDANGYIIFSSGIELNEDVLSMILSHLPEQDLVHVCRLVCKNWCNLIDTVVLKRKLDGSLKRNARVRSLPWYLLYWVLHKKCLDRNLVKNPDGIEQMEHWTILSNGGHKWKVETPPEGTEEPVPCSSCFTTSFHSCSKEQVIDVGKEGAVPALMDAIQPEIHISEWFAGRWDCKAVYELEVHLVKQSGDVVDEFRFRENCGGEYGSHWRQARHTFREYGPGVRYIRVYHGGVDNQFWAGHYGSKMTGAQVVLKLLNPSDRTG